MKKKIIAIVLVVMMIVGNSFMALAATPDVIIGDQNDGQYGGNNIGSLTNNDTTTDVTGIYSGDVTKVYRVDITWTSMSATYTAATGTWDPETLSYSGGDSGSWSTTASVKAENRSNTPVNVTVKNEVKEDVVGDKVVSVIDTIQQDTLLKNLLSAEGANAATLPTATWNLGYKNSPTKKFTDNTAIATITVTVN